jgi:hypothetical protein
MKRLLSTSVAVAALVMLAGCGSSIDVVSQGPDTIAIAADSPNNLDSANGAATDYCKKTQKRAELQKTENAGKGVVAYYACK